MRAGRTIAAVLVLAILTGGCSRLGYYAHLGKGGLSLLAKGHSVEKLLASPKTDETLRERLVLSVSLLRFAEAELGLSVDKKYNKYADLERPYAVWTVVAAPEFSLEPKTWCFPVAGCVGYRGFFSPESAGRFAERTGRDGFDVSVGGVRAFSSLGWFRDPLLNTFVFLKDRELAGLLFHELAHSLVYTSDDTAFNESFASVVERAGVRRWLEANGESGTLDDYERDLAEEAAIYEAVVSVRFELEELYGSDASSKSVAKKKLFARLDAELRALDPERRSSFAGWIGRELNNADLASIGLYRRWLDPLESLLQSVDGDLGEFYAAAACLATLDVEERTRRLENETWSDCILGASRNP